MAAPRFKLYRMTCNLPSAAIDLNSDDNARIAKDVLDIAGDAAEIIPEVGEIIGPVIKLIGGLTSLAAGLAELIDKERREDGLDPDDLYITRYPAFYLGPQITTDNTPQARQAVLWPYAGNPPSEPRDCIQFAKGHTMADNPLLGVDLVPQGGVAFWDCDHGDGSADDLLLIVPFNPALVDQGRQVETYYTPSQDCSYTVEYEIVSQ